MSYFKPIRRKLGVIVLMMACLFTTAWIRSLSTIDEACLFTSQRQHAFGSALGYFCWLSMDRRGTTNPKNYWMSQSVEGSGLTRESIIDQFQESLITLKLLHPQQWVLPYWPIVIGLTMLSMCLLLSKTHNVQKRETLSESLVGV